MVKVRVVGPDDWRLFREVRLQALREAPYAFGATIDYWSGEGDTEQRWRSRLQDVPFNLIAELDGTSAGMVSARSVAADGTAELISMWVAPFARGQNVGDALIAAVIKWAVKQGASRVVLAVRESNTRATDLYRRNRFVDQGPIEDAEGGPPERRMVLVF